MQIRRSNRIESALQLDSESESDQIEFDSEPDPIGRQVEPNWNAPANSNASNPNPIRRRVIRAMSKAWKSRFLGPNKRDSSDTDRQADRQTASERAKIDVIYISSLSVPVQA